jgi:hypothetical protein
VCSWAGAVRITRRDLLKIGGASLAEATLLGIAGCGGGGDNSIAGARLRGSGGAGVYEE